MDPSASVRLLVRRGAHDGQHDRGILLRAVRREPRGGGNDRCEFRDVERRVAAGGRDGFRLAWEKIRDEREAMRTLGGAVGGWVVVFVTRTSQLALGFHRRHVGLLCIRSSCFWSHIWCCTLRLH